ncbi:LacI family DNA-binding transcriptional regulator [Rhodococcus sp. UFZ-B548]|uniref:LacI family DNA-binding transcriptional regulator n=1 Tax=Rhodococcus sp. UFZ-B548 TaxID=2742212 RepID=UPI0015F54A32|nr:LacI family DNA-binding transcriptional regulator [Rhodococcus sp. UFZ-B548]
MASPHTPTLRDVAAAAGVAASTASHALNGKGRVDAATRARVQQIAHGLGYHPNRSAQTLRSHRTSTLALMLPTPVLPAREGLSSAAYLNFDWYGRVATTAAQSAFLADHSLLLLPSMKDPNELRRIEMDGVLVVDPSTHDPRLDILTTRGIPSVAVGPGNAALFASCITPDLATTTATLMNHLTEQGARNILVLTPGTNSEWTRATTMACIHWFRDRNIKPRISSHLTSFPGTHTVEYLAAAAYTTTRNALTSKNPPDAILSLTLGAAPAAARAAHDLGLSIPGDVLIAQDIDEPALLTSGPPITAFDFFPEEQAATAVQLLLALVNGDEAAAQHLARSKLRMRASTGEHRIENQRDTPRATVRSNAPPEPRSHAR